MKKFYALALALVLVGAGCAPVSSPSRQAQEQPVPVPTETEVIEEVSVFDDGFYQLDATQSSMKWQASKLKLGHNGTIAPREGFVRLENDQPTEGSVLVDMATLKNLDQEGAMLQNLEKHLRSKDFFDVEQFPTAAFVVSAMTPVSGIEGSNYRLDGKMTIKNITNTLSFPVMVVKTDLGLKVVGRAVVDRTEYDIKYGSGKFFENLGDNLIDDNFKLDFDLTFVASTEEEAKESESEEDAEGQVELDTEIKGS